MAQRSTAPDVRAVPHAERMGHDIGAAVAEAAAWAAHWAADVRGALAQRTKQVIETWSHESGHHSIDGTTVPIESGATSATARYRNGPRITRSLATARPTTCHAVANHEQRWCGETTRS